MSEQPLFAVSSCWRRERMAHELHQLCYFERATAHVLAGWLVKVPQIDAKVRLGRHLHGAMDGARNLKRGVGAISNYLGGWDWSVPVGWREVMRGYDRATDEVELVAGLYLVAKAALADTCREFLANTYASLDHHLIEVVAAIRTRLDDEVAWARDFVRAAAGDRAVDALVFDARARWVGRDSVARVDGLGDWLWQPQGRVATAVRPQGWARPQAGQAKLHGMDGEPETIADVFHGTVSEELTTMELFARCSYEHPDLPFEFHADMARQTSDESRHATACLEVLHSLGVEYGQSPGLTDSTFVYDYNYQYRGVEPGSKRELLWRLLTRSVFQESLSLDGFMIVIKKREFFDQQYLARLLESLFADEIFHVHSGARWSRYLCGDDGDLMHRESELAHRHYVQTLTDRRNQYCDEFPDQAMAELDHLEVARALERNTYPFPLEVPINRVARRAAGLGDREIQQVVDWGYAHP